MDRQINIKRRIAHCITQVIRNPAVAIGRRGWRELPGQRCISRRACAKADPRHSEISAGRNGRTERARCVSDLTYRIINQVLQRHAECCAIRVYGRGSHAPDRIGVHYLQQGRVKCHIALLSYNIIGAAIYIKVNCEFCTNNTRNRVRHKRSISIYRGWCILPGLIRDRHRLRLGCLSFRGPGIICRPERSVQTDQPGDKNDETQ